MKAASEAAGGPQQAKDKVRPLTGNEAIARGAWEAGVKVAAAYPGTPSTEILETLARYPAEDLHAQWSTNEKVALDVAIGASFAGKRALAAMKHVGLNVAADAFMSQAYIGSNGGLVIAVADDPGIHSSQNEQDTRIYGQFATVPVLEPSDAQEALDFTRLAFELSERFDTIAIVRTTTRLAHTRSPVALGARQEAPARGFNEHGWRTPAPSLCRVRRCPAGPICAAPAASGLAAFVSCSAHLFERSACLQARSELCAGPQDRAAAGTFTRQREPRNHEATPGSA